MHSVGYPNVVDALSTLGISWRRTRMAIHQGAFRECGWQGGIAGERRDAPIMQTPELLPL